jgi:hypothetical protein
MRPITTTLIAIAACACAAGSFGLTRQTAPASAPSAPDSPASHAVANAAETSDANRVLLDALQGKAGTREGAIERLTRAALAPDPSPRHVLHCGLAHLWAAVEGPVDARETHEHAIIAEHWLARAAALRPEDHRIGGWKASATTVIAVMERDRAKAEAARVELERLAVEDPCFHAITLAPASFDRPRTSPEFAKLRTAMDASFECGVQGGIGDGARWPHAVAGFLVAISDVRLKAGDIAGAESALVIAEARESTASWPHRRVLEERIATLRERAARFSNDDPTDDPPFILSGGGAGCRICHAVGSSRP